MVLSVCGCDTGTIRGAIVDVKGEALPGAAVHVQGTSYQGLSNALGEYRVKYVPGELSLYFSKTGYTPGMLLLNVEQLRQVQATPVMLWPLPEGKGVYEFQDYRYRRTDFIEPQQLKTVGDGQIIYGTTRWPRVETTQREPLLICYKMPVYGGKLCQMNQIDVQPPYGQVGSVSAWVKTKDIPVVTEPIDAPEGLLMRIRLSQPLETGSYAVHWGALDGDLTLNEPRMFFFSVVEALTAVPLEPEAPAEEPSPKTPAPAPAVEEETGPSEG
ncbi:MAG: carboxypeptidase regulatory-like domain-containing protein [Candidatus Hydrogenedentes bacterium]|nr:carboxypeptidase regulatory-like domain-containing protein [Candidatus Hydrogenedentota bacterium]